MPAYRFEQPRSPYSVAIADMLRTQNDPAAQAAVQKGNIYGSALQQIGQSIGQIPQQIQQQKADQQTTQIRAAQLKAVEEQAAAEAAAAQADQAIDALLQDSLKTEPDTGLITYDRNKLQAGMTQLGLLEQWPAYQKLLDASDASISSVHKASGDALKTVAQLVDMSGNSAVVFNRELDRAVRNRLILESDAAPYREAAQADPSKIAAITGSILGKGPPKLIEHDPTKEQRDELGNLVTPAVAPPAAPVAPFTLGEGQVRYGSDGQVIAQGPPKTEAPAARMWVMRNGTAVRVREDQIQPGDQPSSTREQGRPVTSGDAGRLADFDTSVSDLAVLKSTLTETAGATGTTAAIGAGLPAWVTDATGWGTDAKKRQGVIDRVKQVIGKTLEGGVLRKEDEVKYEKILPTIKDTAAVAASKLDGLDKAITQRRETFIEALADADYDVTKFSARTPPSSPATAVAPASAPDLSGLTAGRGRQFRNGPFAGQTWSVAPNGQPVRIK